jgi:hypothetical protein
MGKIIGEPLQRYVRDQIKARQKAHGSGTNGSSRTLEQLSYLNSKTAWVKLASSVRVTPERLKEEEIREGFAWESLAKHHVLFSGTSTLNASSDASKILNPRGTLGSSYGDNIWGTQNGTYNVNASTKPSEFGLTPMPGITSVEVKCLNRGSIKRATVNIKCYSPEQFQIIDLLYLRLGYTVFLEWGNSLYLDEDGDLKKMAYTLIEAGKETNNQGEEGYGFFSNRWKDSSYAGFLPVIEGYRKNKKGNYDGLLSKVVNFSWSFAQDGSYDISLELISLGDVIESLKLNIAPSLDVSNFIDQTYALYKEENTGDEDAQIPPSPSDNWISAYLFLQKLYVDKKNSNDGYDAYSRQESDSVSCTIQGKPLELGGVFVRKPEGGITVEDGVIFRTSNYETRQDVIAYIESLNLNPTSVSYNVLADVFNSDVNAYTIIYDDGGYYGYLKTFPSLDPLNIDQSPRDVVYLNYNSGVDDEDGPINDQGFYMRFAHLLKFIKQFVVPSIEYSNNNGNEVPMVNIDLDEWGTEMYIFPYQVSLDPRVCIVNGEEKISEKEYFPQLVQWKNLKKGCGLTMNIYINHAQILTSLNENMDEKGNVNLFDFLNSICIALNKALGGVNNLEPVLDEDTNTIYIIDGSYQPTSPQTYELELYGYNPDQKNTSNFVRNFNLKTEITNDFATMATIGSTAGGYTKGVENTMFSKWNKGLQDPWKEKYVPPKNARTTSTSGSIDEPNELYVKEFWSKLYSPFGYTLKDVEYDLFTSDKAAINDEIIDKNITLVTEFYKYCQTKIQEETSGSYASPTSGFIPINLSVTMDGISGVKIYNEINVNTRFLPRNYPKNLRFIIKGVNHKLSDSDWETTIETVTISKSE